MFVGIAFILVFFAEYPFWINAPENFCLKQRTKAKICAFASELSSSTDDLIPIYIVGHGWHTGLMIRTQDLPENYWRDELDLDQASAIEIGWGDEGFYRATDYTASLAFKAFALPTPSVMHVVRLTKPAPENFPHSDIYIYWATPSEYQKFLDFVNDTFTRGVDGKVIDLGTGLYGDSKFFRANGSYYFPKSCNAWVAKSLAHAGAPIWPSLSLTARNTLHQIELVGEVLQKTPGFKILPN